MRLTPFLLASFALTAAAAGQVRIFDGPSTNTTTTIDFDVPFVASGPISGTDATFTGNGISSVDIIGAWFPNGDALTAASNVNGQGLTVTAGGLTIGTSGDPLDEPNAGDGISFTLSSAVDEFGLTFTDQVNFCYKIELFSGATSLGFKSVNYGDQGFPAPGFIARGPSPFDRVEIIFTRGNGGVGFDALTLGNGPSTQPPLPDNCAETSFTGGNGGNIDGAVYFDLTTTGPVAISSLMTHFQEVAGSAAGLMVYTTPDTFVGKETDGTQWTLAAQDDGSAIAAGPVLPTTVTFQSPLMLGPGTTGICLAAINVSHAYTNGDGFNQVETSTDGTISISAGSASNTLFDPAFFTPRVWNGQICSVSASVGTNYCGPGVANSTGMSATISASGSTSVAANNMTLRAEGLPVNAFSFFLTSQMQGFVMGPGGSQGNLCLGGAVGRYVGAGQIQQAGATGEISLAIDLTAIPQPMGLVSGMAGETWNFQAWHRDAVMGMATSNFTDGLEVTLTN